MQQTQKEIGSYKKRYEIEANITEITKIIKPYCRGYGKKECELIAAHLWKSISKIQHLHLPNQTIYEDEVTSAINQFESTKKMVKQYLDRGRKIPSDYQKYVDIV